MGGKFVEYSPLQFFHDGLNVVHPVQAGKFQNSPQKTHSEEKDSENNYKSMKTTRMQWTRVKV